MPRYIYTGPDGHRNHRKKLLDPKFVGQVEQSEERTNNTGYLWRSARNTPHPRPKSAFSGSIGWGLEEMGPYCRPKTSCGIKMDTFRQAVEQKVTHLYQNAWYPGPHDVMRSYTDSAQVPNIYNRPSVPAATAPVTIAPQPAAVGSGGR